MAFFGKKFKRVSAENLEAFMDALNVDEKMRAFAKSGNSVTSFLDNGDGTYTHSVESETRPFKYNFKLNEEFEFPRPDGVTVKSTYKLDGNKLVQDVKDPEGRSLTFVREFEDNKLKMILSVSGKDVTSTINYEAV